MLLYSIIFCVCAAEEALHLLFHRNCHIEIIVHLKIVDVESEENRKKEIVSLSLALFLGALG